MARAFGSYPKCRGFESPSRYHSRSTVMWIFFCFLFYDVINDRCRCTGRKETDCQKGLDPILHTFAISSDWYPHVHCRALEGVLTSYGAWYNNPDVTAVAQNAFIFYDVHELNSVLCSFPTGPHFPEEVTSPPAKEAAISQNEFRSRYASVRGASSSRPFSAALPFLS